MLTHHPSPSYRIALHRMRMHPPTLHFPSRTWLKPGLVQLLSRGTERPLTIPPERQSEENMFLSNIK